MNKSMNQSSKRSLLEFTSAFFADHMRFVMCAILKENWMKNPDLLFSSTGLLKSRLIKGWLICKPGS